MDADSGDLNVVSALAVSSIMIMDRSYSLSRTQFLLSGTNVIYWKFSVNHTYKQ